MIHDDGRLCDQSWTGNWDICEFRSGYGRSKESVQKNHSCVGSDARVAMAQEPQKRPGSVVRGSARGLTRWRSGNGLRQERRTVLADAFEQAEPGATLIVPMAARKTVNLRTHLEKIITKAGHEPWPQLLQNLRAS